MEETLLTFRRSVLEYLEPSSAILNGIFMHLKHVGPVFPTRSFADTAGGGNNLGVFEDHDAIIHSGYAILAADFAIHDAGLMEGPV